jgi:N-acetylglutamate synthase-like GNAT family acetyltransferase
MVNFIVADLKLHRPELLKLNIELFSWYIEEVQKREDLDFNTVMNQTVEEYVESTIESLMAFRSNEGVFYLLQEGKKVVGMGGLHKLYKDVGEIKRMYVRPEFRGKGYGKELLQKLLIKGKEFGFSTIYLETGIFMKAAQHIYRSAGFVEREEYPETEVHSNVRHLWIFMEKKLS